MADERQDEKAESRETDVIAGDHELRDANDRAADEGRAWSGDLEARKRRGREEMFNDARGDRSDLAWGAGGMQGDDRSDSVTAIPDDDRAMHDERLGEHRRHEKNDVSRKDEHE